MIYKIQSEKKDATTIFNVIENIGDFMFLHETFYLYSNLSSITLKKKIKKSLPKESQFMVIDVDISNIQSTPSSVQSWVKDKLIKEEIRKYELENQEVLKRFNEVIDTVHAEFESQKERSVDIDSSEEN